jgi:glycosyltransferase involved in cell wall biosynthesis
LCSAVTDASQSFVTVTLAAFLTTLANYFALTRILVVPSVWEEPFGTVTAEAMINAIPPLVSNRGSLLCPVDRGMRG